MSNDDLSIKECRENFCRLVLNDPPLMKMQKDHSYFEGHEEIKRKLNYYLEKKEKLIFLVGSWGSGKTLFIEKFKSEENNDFYFKMRSFFSISSLNEAYIHTAGLAKAVTIFFLLALIIFIFSNIIVYYDFEFISISLLLGYIFVTNKFKLTYACCEYMSSFSKILAIKGLPLVNLIYQILEKRGKSFSKKHRVYILDDLDSSSLKEDDRWALLANLWNLKTTYIVLLGYSDEKNAKGKSKFEIIEMCEKLEGKIIFLPISWQDNEKILNEYMTTQFLLSDDYKMPFQDPEWLSHFTPRELINIVDDFKYNFDEFKFKKYAQVGHAFFKCLLLRDFINAYFIKIPNFENDEMQKSYLVIRTENEISPRIKNFFKSIDTFLNNDVFKTGLEDADFFNRKKVFLESKEQMLKFFDDNIKHWTKNDDEDPLP